MTNPKSRKKARRGASTSATGAASAARRFEAEAVALQSLRLIAAPNPKDDLSRDEIVQAVRRSEHSSELITQLIDFIKTL